MYYNELLIILVIGEYLVAPLWDVINIDNSGTISYEIFKSFVVLMPTICRNTY